VAQLLTPETFEFFARYLLAGYVVIFVRSTFVAGLRPKPTELLIEAVLFSLIVEFFVVGFTAIGTSLQSIEGTTESFPAWFFAPNEYFTFLARIVFVPATLGVVLGYFLKSNIRGAIFRRLSLPVVHPVRRAHDFAFGNEREASLVIVTYEDGTSIRGLFGERSLAASDDNRSDLYLERLYIEKTKGGPWIEPSPGRSCLITLNGVRSIEFLDTLGDDNG